LIEQHPLLRLQLIERSDRGVAAARNSGFYRSEGQVVLFIDDDSLPLSADALLDVFSQADGAVYGYGAQRLWTDARRYPEPHEQIDQNIARGDFRPLRAICGRPQPSLRQKDSTKYLERTFIGNFGFVRRAALAAIGGWPEEFIGYGCEDDLMAFLLYRRWGGPQILSNLQVAHITHGLSPRSFEEYQKNLALYQRILAAHGVVVQNSVHGKVMIFRALGALVIFYLNFRHVRQAMRRRLHPVVVQNSAHGKSLRFLDIEGFGFYQTFSHC
jgi:glycosyltransferase involved in cell wall biosynthesis